MLQIVEEGNSLVWVRPEHDCGVYGELGRPEIDRLGMDRGVCLAFHQELVVLDLKSKSLRFGVVRCLFQ